MTSPPSITVVIPTHNDARYLEESVPSVLAQRYPGDLEVVIVDDGSNPPAETVYRPPDSRVRIHTPPPGGVSAARNAGIREARGELIAFLDADDLMLPGRLERQAALLARCPEALLAGCDVTRRDLDGDEKSWGIFEAFGAEIPREQAPGGVPEDFLFAAEFRGLLLAHYPFNTSVIMTRRAALTPDTMFDPALICWEDWDFVTRLAWRGRVAYCRLPLVLYRKRPGSITTTGNPRKFLSKTAMLRKWRKTLPGLNAAQKHDLRMLEAKAWLTASHELRRENRAAALGCALRSFAMRPSPTAARSALGALLR